MFLLPMLARLQRGIALTLLVLALGWLWHTLPQGRGWAAAAGLALLGTGHALVLGLEFLLMRRANRSDPAPRAGWGATLRAWWGESAAAPRVFLWQQPFRSRRWPDRPDAAARGRRGVLLVHGFVCNRGLWNRWLERLTAAGVPFVAVDLEPVFGSIDAYTARIEEGVARLEAATGRPPLAVAHSMGGLALRRWRAQPGHAARLQHVVTLGTPHRGTWLARFGLTPNAHQMRRDSAWIEALQGDERRHAADDFGAFTCFYGHCDNIVFPAHTAALPGADNRHLAGTAHVHMVDHPEPWAELECRLGLTSPDRTAGRSAAAAR